MQARFHAQARLGSRQTWHRPQAIHVTGTGQSVQEWSYGYMQLGISTFQSHQRHDLVAIQCEPRHARDLMHMTPSD